MIKGSINHIESFGLLDGPGIRTVVFMNGCNLRCKYCHNPEMWTMKENNYTTDELFTKIMKNKEYFGKKGGVTFSGGEALLQSEFLLEICKKLKLENIHIALDTSGVYNNNYQEILNYIDLIILDIKDVTEERYFSLTNYHIDKVNNFIETINKLNKKVWIRQVIVPGIHDNIEYIKMLNDYIKNIKNIEKIEFLPYHKMGDFKYSKLGIVNPFKDIPSMDKDKCNELYNYLIKIKEEK